MLLNLLLLACIIATAVAWFQQRNQPELTPLAIIVPAGLAGLIAVFQIFFGGATGQRASAVKLAAQDAFAETQFSYAAGWKLSQEAAQQNPKAQVLVIVSNLAPKETNTEQGQWLRGVQEAAKTNGLQLTLVPISGNDRVSSSRLVPGAQEIKAEACQRLQQEHTNATVWLSYYVPETASLDTLSFLATDQVRLFCHAQFITWHQQLPAWWTAALQSGRVQAWVLERYPHGINQKQRGKPTNDVEANFKASYFLLTAKASEVPPEISAQLPENFRR